MKSQYAKEIYALITTTPNENKKGKEAAILRTLDVINEDEYNQKKELMQLLFSNHRVFNLKPKKEWSDGSDSPTATWEDAYTVLMALEDRTVTGNEAKNLASGLCQSMEPWATDLFKRCLAKRPDAGMQASTINGAIKGYIPQFKCSLAQPFEEKKLKFPCLAEPKLDGVRTLAHVNLDSKDVVYYSRSGLPFTSMSHLNAHSILLAKLLADNYHLETGIEITEVVIDGEVYGDNFKQTVSDARKKSGNTESKSKYHVYDWIPGGDFFEQISPYEQEVRSSDIKKCVSQLLKEVQDSKVLTVETTLVHSYEEAKELYQKYRDMNLEGLILKYKDAMYAFKRNHCWMKIKPVETEDLKIVGYKEGTGKYEGMLGAFIVDYKGVHVDVGSGITDEQRLEYWNTRDACVGRLIEVEFMEETEDGSLRHPTFEGFRDLPSNPGVKI